MRRGVCEIKPATNNHKYKRNAYGRRISVICNLDSVPNNAAPTIPNQTAKSLGLLYVSSMLYSMKKGKTVSEKKSGEK